MTNEERNTALYQKMFAEQEKFRDWLKGQSPEDILNHAYEYTIYPMAVSEASGMPILVIQSVEKEVGLFVCS